MHCTPVDFRKSINGLLMIVESDMALLPFSESLFVFGNASCDKIKKLYWNKTRFCLWCKRLEKDKFKWPRTGDAISSLSAEQFDEADGDAAEIEAEQNSSSNTIEIPAHTRSTKRRVSIPPDIPRIDIIHDLLDDQKICPHDGAALKRIGSETHVQLDIIPAKVQALNHIRYKYAYPAVKNI